MRVIRAKRDDQVPPPSALGQWRADRLFLPFFREKKKGEKKGVFVVVVAAINKKKEGGA